jgi:hypothetical protein
MKLTTLTTATLILCSSLFSINPADSLPEYDLVKKDFINGEINNERLSQIILKDPRLVPKSRGGLKNDVDASSDGLGVLVIGKILNGSVDSIELKNDNSHINHKMNYLITKYGEEAKLAGMSTIDYVKNGVKTGVLSGIEAETIKSNLSRDDIVSIELSSSNINPFLSDIVTINSSIIGNENDSELIYKWTHSNNVNIESDNGQNIIISFNESGPFEVNLQIVNSDGNGEGSFSGLIGVNSVNSIKEAYNSVSAKADGFVLIQDISTYAKWDGIYWKDVSSNETLRYISRRMVKESINFNVSLYQDTNEGNYIIVWQAYLGIFERVNYMYSFLHDGIREGENYAYSGNFSTHDVVRNRYIDLAVNLTEYVTAKSIVMDRCKNTFDGKLISIGKVIYNSNPATQNDYEYNGYSCVKNVETYTCTSGYTLDEETNTCMAYLPY